MGTIYYIGGAQGVGKTTIINEVSEKIGVPRFSTGRLISKLKNLPEATQQNLDIILKNNDLLLDTHYSANNDLHRTQIYSDVFSDNDINKIQSKHELIFMLIDLDPATLFERRKLDYGRKRNLESMNIGLDLYHNKMRFEDCISKFSNAGLLVKNYDLEKSIENIISYMQILNKVSGE